MSEPTKALLIVIGVIAAPIIVVFFYLWIKEYYEDKNAEEFDFREEDGKVKGYRKDKRGNWVYDETLYLEDDLEFNPEQDLKDDH